MTIDGKKIAQEILDDLRMKINNLKKQGTTPHLHIITLTDDQASEAYVGQKIKKGKEIGAKITVENLDPRTSEEILLDKINNLNQDSSVHGLIIQRPFSSHIDEEKIANSINPQKDVDGFHPGSKFIPPIALASLRILDEVISKEELKSKKIAVVGRGVTAGKPIIKTLQGMGIEPRVITSQTQNKEKILKNSDIVIGAVGKPEVIRTSDLKKGVTLVGIGMFRGDDGKFHSDYNEEEIKDISSHYTPTPGGVGPVNVAMLLSNLVKAAEQRARS
jgi:methylenetetrahydrofolate dehydrogenase (NADP+)/methenyltetrahydrofolate cyclohydrolase